MCLQKKLRELIDAGFSGLWVQTQEPDEAIGEIRKLATAESYRLATWDCCHGLDIGEGPDSNGDPLAAINALPAMADGEHAGLLVLTNLHRYLQGPEITQALFHAIQQGKRSKTFAVILAPIVQIPTELEKLIVVIEHDLPARTDLEEIARGIATEEGEMPEGADLDKLLDAAAGLTRYEAEGAFALSLVRHSQILPDAVWQLKAGALKKNGTLTLHRGKERFADLGGLEHLKDFSLRCMRPSGRIRPKGLMLLGVPGTGKSCWAKSLGNETGRPCITLDMGALMGSLVGQTEERTRAALQVIDAMAPAVLFCDEIEKALAGTGTDTSGVTTRMFGTLLTWMNDHESDIFVVCTSNDISKLPPEFTRAGRFDAVFFLDLPTAKQREQIWAIHCARYGVDADQPRPEAENWTGAEIESCCRLAALLDVPLTEAAVDVVPVATTAADRVEGLRQWAAGRVLDADHPGRYSRTRTPEPARRAVTRR
jgi:hypothetical protein